MQKICRKVKTYENDTYTVRDRDTMEQIRLTADELIKYVEEKIQF